MMELIAYETWHEVLWLDWQDQDKALHRWIDCKCEGQVGGFEATNHMWRGSLSKDLALMDQGNREHQVKLRSMNQWGQMMIWSGSYHSRKIKPRVDSKWWSKSLMEVGACGINIWEDEMECAGKCMTCRAFHFIGHRCVEKCMTEFRIDGRTIKRGKLVCISVI